MTNERSQPRWTVCYNIVSRESDQWIGHGWEFFDDEASAKACYERQIAVGNCPTKRAFHPSDGKHLGAVHRWPSDEPAARQVKRYSWVSCSGHEGSGDTWTDDQEDPEGEWVKYEDIKHLL